ncbi:MAG: TetR/AcrR family transcriptional regulator [Actinobacteria bacterium]|nr:TetR/AcrR family transcriptional regulator [Actinomycetota bacterium]
MDDSQIRPAPDGALRPPLSEFLGQLPGSRAQTGEREEVLRSQRGRLMAALVELSSERGYEAVSIIEIVTLAGTSKRTFYEHFADKNDCLLQAFDLAEAFLVQTVENDLAMFEDPAQRVAAGMRAYLRALSEAPEFTRLFLSETSAYGPPLAERWARALDRFGEVMEQRREKLRETDPELPPLPAMQVRAATAGLSELIRLTVFREGVAALEGMADDMAELAVTLFSARPQPGREA